MTEINLTQKELDDIKDDIKWRTQTTIYLKQMHEAFIEHCDSSKEFRSKVDKVDIHQTIQWFLLSGIIISILWFKFIP